MLHQQGCISFQGVRTAGELASHPVYGPPASPQPHFGIAVPSPGALPPGFEFIAASREPHSRYPTIVCLSDVDLMSEVSAYNEVDCRVMMEAVRYLRGHRPAIPSE